MITFTNVFKRFGSHIALNKINLKLPRTGLIIIEGPSGCGKTTLLNLLSGLIDFEGDINVDGHHINLMDKNELDEYRLKNYGFIFQDFKLFENESVINNVMFPLETISSSTRETKIRKCIDLVTMVGLKNNIKQKVNKLSGGEKQRVAIARALVNGPKIILADEPTGSLDSANAIEIMNILEKISNRSLVVMVSHDDELASRYADQLIKMEDGNIVDIQYRSKKKDNKYIPIAKLIYSARKPSVPSSLLISHTMNSVKQKKWRTSICNMVTSLGLIGVGLATSLSTSISENIKKSYSQIIDESKIAVTMKNEGKSIYGQYAANYYEVMDLANKYHKYIYDVGVTYHNDFESFFPQTNSLCLANSTYYHQIPGISIRHVNEFKWLDVEGPNIMYPERVEYLDNNQIVLGLTINMIQDICFQLHIERTVTSLSRYMQTNELKVFFDLRNDYWSYSDQQLFQVVAFSLEHDACIYHNNHMWNEHILEERMRFPSTDALTEQKEVPWYLKKIYYFYVKKNRDEFLRIIKKEKDFDSYIVEIASESYYPWLMKEKRAKESQRLLIFSNFMSNIPMRYIDFFQEVSSEVCHPIYGSYSGYSIYPSNMMYGFSNYTYFSSNLESLEETIDIQTTLNTNSNESVALPSDVKCGHFSQSLSGGVNFSVIDDLFIEGRKPYDLSEIVISRKLADSLFAEDPINKTLHVASMVSQYQNTFGEIIRNFKTVDLTVVGIVDSDKNLIYHEEEWPILFFQVMLDISAFNLGINSMILEVRNEKNVDSIITKLKRAFPDYEFSNPMSEINKSISQVCGYIEIALMCFSIIAVVISTLLLSICNYLYILENKKDIGLVRCIGVNKKEASKFVITHSMIMCFISFILSSLELFLISFVISEEVAKNMGNAFNFSFNFMSLVYMFALAFAISLISSLFISIRVNKLDPISALKS